MAYDTKRLKTFKLYDIHACQYLLGDMCMLSGHDNDVSMRVVLMGLSGNERKVDDK